MQAGRSSPTGIPRRRAGRPSSCGQQAGYMLTTPVSVASSSKAAFISARV